MSRRPISATLEKPSGFHWDISNRTALGHYLLEFEWHFISHFLPEKISDIRVLDIACGSGRLPTRFFDQGYPVVGMVAD